MAVRYNKKRHDYGTKWEQKLQPLLEAFVGEPLTKTRHLYDIMDFVSKSYFVELKCRSKKYHPADFQTWLLPSCKGKEAAKHPDKITIFFYYWETTDELYLIEYNDPLFQTFHREVPSWHLEKQEHYYVPTEEFSLIEFVE